MQTCCTLITNMVTGLIIWQDLNTLGDNLFVYVIMHLIMLLGIWLLAPEDAIQQYKASEGRGIAHQDAKQQIELAKLTRS